LLSQDNGPSAEEKHAQLARVVDSAVLQNAPMLQKLLEFLGSQAINGDTEEINETALAIKVFGRSDDFDPTTDTSVRTAVYRLRTKLREYYAAEGKLDPISVEIRKGHYAPVFRRQLCSNTSAASQPSVPLRETPHAESVPVTPEPPKRQRSIPIKPSAVAAGLLLFIGGLAAGVILAISSNARDRTAARSEPLDSLWRSFLGSERTVLVTFSNAELLQTDTRDLLRYDVGAVDARGAEVDPSLAAKHVALPQFVRNHSLFYEDGYSGTGEVNAVHALTRMLSKAGVDVLVKRVRLLTTDDLKAHNVVLLGSSQENRAVAELHLGQSYVFDFPSGSRSSWAGRIFDKRAVPGASAASWSVQRDPKTKALLTDYAVFAVVPGVAPNRRVMMLAGLTTSGTQGAAEFATSSSQVAELLNSLFRGGPPSLFEAILEVQVVQGLDPVSVRRVAARRLGE
jgi:hypothetical protein